VASVSVSEELLVDGGWDDPLDRAPTTVVEWETRAPVSASADGERWPQ
jgi:hypothetical protein